MNCLIIALPPALDSSLDTSASYTDLWNPNTQMKFDSYSTVGTHHCGGEVKSDLSHWCSHRRPSGLAFKKNRPSSQPAGLCDS